MNARTLVGLSLLLTSTAACNGCGSGGGGVAADACPGCEDARPPGDDGAIDEGPRAAFDLGGADASRPDPGDVPDWIGITHGLDKVRPESPLPAARSVGIEAARNEFEPFQIVVDGGASGRTVTGFTGALLTGPGGAAIGPDHQWAHRVGLYRVGTPSNDEGAPGLWPDPLIPDVDVFYGEKRNAFPLEVPAGQRRAIWVDVLVPLGIPGGLYQGTFTLDTSEGAVAIRGTVRVFDFDLPSTATLGSAFATGWDAPCVAHHGSYDACGGDAGIERFNLLYAQAALDHRVSIDTVVYHWPDGDDWRHFDGVYGPLLEGRAPFVRLPGARLTTLEVYTQNAPDPELAARQRLEHFETKGWGVRMFNYTCDEPPAGCAWEQISRRGDPVRRAGLRTLVTTDLGQARQNGVLGSIDILVPLMNWVYPGGPYGARESYDAWLGEDAKRELWWYQSCISHGCGAGCSPSPGRNFTGNPSVMIDASGIQNRAMEWFSFASRMTGELYFSTTQNLRTAWDDQCDFSGQGDGTLFYPGTPERIGGQSHIPVMSQRFKLIREGMEDYEYLNLLAVAGDRATAEQIARSLFPRQDRTTEATPAKLFAARHQIAELIEATTR